MLEILANELLEFSDADFIAPIKRPLPDPLGEQKAGLGQDLQVLACGRLAYAQLFGEQEPADTVFDQVPIYLRTEMGNGVFQPVQDLKTPFIR
jgi:hypothetical protein